MHWVFSVATGSLEAARAGDGVHDGELHCAAPQLDSGKVRRRACELGVGVPKRTHSAHARDRPSKALSHNVSSAHSPSAPPLLCPGTVSPLDVLLSHDAQYIRRPCAPLLPPSTSPPCTGHNVPVVRAPMSLDTPPTRGCPPTTWPLPC